MAEISRKALFGKLNDTGYKSVESATVFCKLRGNPYVELVHWIHQIAQLPDSDMHRILKRFECDMSRLAADMTAALEKLPRGSTSIQDFSPHLEAVVEKAWLYGTLMFGEMQVRTGHLLVGAVQTRDLRHVLLDISPEFSKIKPDPLAEEFDLITKGSPEERMGATDGFAASGAVPGEASEAVAPAVMGKQEALAKFSEDLTEKAKAGGMDPIVGRDEEIRQIVDILMRRRQNNPILTGEAGVGKTAVVEGFAQRIAAGDVPPPLQGVSLRVLDIGLLQAGASMKGEFEQRLRQVVEEVQSSPKPIILFVDEAHTLIGAGGAAGTGDAANLLKPAMARGTLRMVAATTWAEYKKHIEKDPALTRRFQVVKVEEPTEEKALLMMRGVASKLEEHHRVQVLDEALEAAVKLSRRYIPSRQLPDKSVSLLDTVCARVAISQSTAPFQVEDSRRRIEALETEQGILGRETAVGIDHERRAADLAESLAQERAKLQELEQAWQRERELCERILAARARLRLSTTGAVEGTGTELDQAADKLAEEQAEQEAAEESQAEAEQQPAPDPTEAPSERVEVKTPAAEGEADAPLSEEERAKLLEELRAMQTELEALQGENPLILPSVDAQAVAGVVAEWTGIPVGRMVKNEIAAVLTLADTLEKRVLGQRHALDTIARRIQTSRAAMDNPNRPIGVFMLVGPSGVGKTETALALAEALYGGEENVVTINMSEFQEAHTVSTLKGAPPGYVGYGEGGVLTEAVRRRPYSVVLLDEVEKAHPDVHEVFFQVFDKGWMEDGEGRYIDFKNTIILLTSNVGSDLVMNLCKDPEMMPDPKGIAQALRTPLLQTFPAALLGRLEVTPFYPIGDETLRLIVKLQLDRIAKRLMDNHRIEFVYDDAVMDLIRSRCTEVESGARMVDAILTHTMLSEISSSFLTQMMEGKEVRRATVSVQDSEFAYAFE